MKIRDIETFVVGNPPPGFGGRYFLFVKLVTDTGIEGFGEIYCATFSPHVVEKMIQDTAERHLVGRDPRRIEDLVRRVYGSGYTLRPDVSLGAVLSGLEMACWDILGKEVGKPVHALLGGWVRERLRTYTYLYPAADEGNDFYTDPERSAERAAQYVREGFTAIKFDPAGPYSVYDGRQPALDDLELSERFCARIREAVGDDADLLFGTHGQFTPAGAIRPRGRIAGGQENRGARRDPPGANRTPPVQRPHRRRGRDPARRMHPQLPGAGRHPGLDRLSCGAAQDADPVGRGTRDRAGHAGAGRRVGRRRGASPPLDGQGAASRDAGDGTMKPSDSREAARNRRRGKEQRAA